ncbi:MAG: hypothetical protein WA919_20230 [Coleofasciculaceae cyanobacterium]
MAGSPLNKYILTPVLISASIFAVLTFPLALLGSKPITIELQEEPVFHGKLRDAAPPYLGLTTLISLGAGLASLAVTGWKESANQTAKMEEQISGLEQSLKEKELHFKELQLSQPRLEAYGLEEFLPESVRIERQTKKTAASENVHTVVEAQVVNSERVEPQPLAAQPQTISQPQTVPQPVMTRGQAAASNFTSAQAFLGHSQNSANSEPSLKETSLSPSDIQELHSQLQQIKTQMASLQKAIKPQLAASEVANAEGSKNVNSQPPQVVQSWAVYNTHS